MYFFLFFFSVLRNTDRVRIFVGDYDRANVEGTEQIIEAAIDKTNNTALHPDYDFGRQGNSFVILRFFRYFFFWLFG